MCKLDPYKDGRFVADIKLRHIDNIAEQGELPRAKAPGLPASQTETCSKNR